MKVLGKINIMGMDVYQLDKIPDFDALLSYEDVSEDEEMILSAKVGSYFYADPLAVYQKKSKDRFIKSTYRVMMMNMLTWNITLLEASESDRQKIVNLTLKAIENFNQLDKDKARGNKEKISELEQEGLDAVGFLKDDCQMVGFAPSVTYIMPKSRGEGSLENFWEHPFSVPTIAFKHKRLPFLILTNGNLEFDSSKLRKIFEYHQNLNIEGINEVDEVEEPEDGLGILG